jgi:signal transduction histidine kinase
MGQAGERVMKRQRFSLRVRILIIVGALVLLGVGGALVTIRYISWMGSVLSSTMDRDIAAFKVAQELETALVMQKGFLSYYVQDGSRDWLAQMNHYRTIFTGQLEKARQATQMAAAKEILEMIESEYRYYVHSKDQVIRLYEGGEREASALLHKEVREEFLIIAELCEQFKQLHEKSLDEARTQIHHRAEFITDLALTTMPGVILLGILLGYVLVIQVLEPIRKLAMGMEGSGARVEVKDEVKALSRQVRGLMEDADQTRSQLEQSQEQLLRSEKLALAGKLAAGVAHSIRNPLTSVKMRLFSMQRALALSPPQKEDVAVISEEIRHIESIVRNFLEFSRPAKLRMQRVSPSDIVDMALQLLRHRLDSYGVRAEVIRQECLPEILADPDQLKEVFVNLMVNACEAMPAGGLIQIREGQGIADALGWAVVIEVTDTGPGIPDTIQDQVLQPFFSTKEEGTGLGLSIAARIVEEHEGRLELRSHEGMGTTFIITLPLREEEAWARS